jgi:mannose-1-phosphate guanylyltransferase
MKALLLAAGFGTRLGNLTSHTPKPLVKVNGKPMLAFCIEQLAYAGVTEVIINTHYLVDQINEFVLRNDFPLRIEISHEAELLGTAGTLKKHIESLAEEDFIVMHADNYFEDSLSNFVYNHQAREVGKFGTLGTFETQNPESCGVLLLNKNRTIREFHEKVLNPPSKIANAAIYAFTPDVKKPLLQLSKNENDISKHLIPKILNGLFTYSFKGLFVDIGTPEGLNLAITHELELRRSETS